MIRKLINMAKEQECHYCFWGTLLYFILISVIYIPVFFDTYYENESYELTNCTVTRIEYPLSINNNKNWRECRCGKNCKAYSPTVNIFVKVDEYKNKSFLINIDYIKKDYTFFKDYCKEGNKPGMKLQYLEESKQIVSKFNNSSFECYFNDETQHACFEKYDPFNTFLNYFIMIVLSILFICCCCQLGCNYKKICNCCCCK